MILEKGYACNFLKYSFESDQICPLKIIFKRMQGYIMEKRSQNNLKWT